MATGSRAASTRSILPGLPPPPDGPPSPGGALAAASGRSARSRSRSTMFLAAVFLLFVGTLAQDEKNLPEVKAEYFNSWLAKVPFSDFFPGHDLRRVVALTGWFPVSRRGDDRAGAAGQPDRGQGDPVPRGRPRASGCVWGTVVSLLGGLLDAGGDSQRPSGRRAPGPPPVRLRRGLGAGAGGRGAAGGRAGRGGRGDRPHRAGPGRGGSRWRSRSRWHAA